MNYENIQIIKDVFDNNPDIRNIILKKYGLVNEKNIDKTHARDELTSLFALLEAVYKHINQNKNNEQSNARKNEKNEAVWHAT